MKNSWAIQVRMPNGVKMFMDHDGRLNADASVRHSWWLKKEAETYLRSFKRMNSRIFWNGRYIGLPAPKLIPV